jgi:hypothetical protein
VSLELELSVVLEFLAISQAQRSFAVEAVEVTVLVVTVEEGLVFLQETETLEPSILVEVEVELEPPQFLLEALVDQVL